MFFSTRIRVSNNSTHQTTSQTVQRALAIFKEWQHGCFCCITSQIVCPALLPTPRSTRSTVGSMPMGFGVTFYFGPTSLVDITCQERAKRKEEVAADWELAQSQQLRDLYGHSPYHLNCKHWIPIKVLFRSQCYIKWGPDGYPHVRHWFGRSKNAKKEERGTWAVAAAKTLSVVLHLTKESSQDMHVWLGLRVNHFLICLADLVVKSQSWHWLL